MPARHRRTRRGSRRRDIRRKNKNLFSIKRNKYTYNLGNNTKNKLKKLNIATARMAGMIAADSGYAAPTLILLRLQSLQYEANDAANKAIEAAEHVISMMNKLENAETEDEIENAFLQLRDNAAAVMLEVEVMDVATLRAREASEFTDRARIVRYAETKVREKLNDATIHGEELGKSMTDAVMNIQSETMYDTMFGSMMKQLINSIKTAASSIKVELENMKAIPLMARTDSIMNNVKIIANNVVVNVMSLVYVNEWQKTQDIS